MVDQKKIKEAVRLLLEGIGEEAEREGLKETPDRIARMYTEIFSGMDETAADHLSKTFSVSGNDMVVEKDIVFYSTCEHHLMPFYGKAHIAYIPDGKVVGLSKLARCVEVFAKRPQIQEKMTAQIADAIMEHLQPKGVIVMEVLQPRGVLVVIEAEHMCMTMRGVKKPGSMTMTYAARGAFEEERQQEKFFRMVRR